MTMIPFPPSNNNNNNNTSLDRNRVDDTALLFVTKLDKKQSPNLQITYNL